MAKLFYTLDEAAQKLHKTPDEVMAMARSGQLQDLKDKDQVLFRRSAIDQLAAEDDSGELSLDNFDAGSGSGSDIRLGGSSIGGDELRIDSPPAAASGVDDSMLDELTQDAPVTNASANADLNLDDSIGLADSRARSRSTAHRPKADNTDISLGDSGDSMMLNAPGGKPGLTKLGDSGAMDAGNTNLETVGSGSGLLDISSDESFFGAQMIEESMGGEGEGGGAIPGDVADIFGGGEQGASEEAAPVTAGTAGVTFGSTMLAEARDPAFSGFAAGSMLVAAVGLIAVAWATVELVVGGYGQVGKLLTDNALAIVGGLAGGVFLAGAIGAWIGKSTA